MAHHEFNHIVLPRERHDPLNIQTVPTVARRDSHGSCITIRPRTRAYARPSISLGLGPSGNGLDRYRENPVGITPGAANTRTSHIDPEPGSAPHGLSAASLVCGNLVAHGIECRGDRGDIGAATLRKFRFAAAAAAKNPGDSFCEHSRIVA